LQKKHPTVSFLERGKLMFYIDFLIYCIYPHLNDNHSHLKHQVKY